MKPVEGIKVQKLSYTYLQNTPFEFKALKEVSLCINRGEFFAIVGPSGSGKSTLVRHLNGLLVPPKGTVFVNGKDLKEKKNRKTLWSQVGLVFQLPERQFFAETVFDEVAFGPRNLGLKDQVKERVYEALEFMGLDAEKIKGLSPYSLSGGMKRSVAIASVLALRPEILVLDEPTAGLDNQVRERFWESISHLRLTCGITVILVTHDMNDVARYAEKMAVIHLGRVKIIGSPREIFNSEAVLLDELGLSVPFAVKVVNMLKQKGLNLAGQAATIKEAALQIADSLPGGAGKDRT